VANALVLVETSGNQDFIFDTNKLRENVGASELIWRLGATVLEAVRDEGGPDLTGTGSLATARERADLLSDARQNPPLEAGDHAVEVVLAASGMAMLLVRDTETGQRIVQRVTGWSQARAPGLAVHGVVVPLDLLGDRVHEVVGHAHRELGEVRARLPGPASRFLRLPIVADCASSGLPAERVTRPVPEEDPVPLSAVALGKLAATEDGYDRVRGLVRSGGIGLPRSLSELERRLGTGGWFGLVHADGNGVGGLLSRIDEHLDARGVERNRAYLDGLRRFSVELDRCTEAAFLDAVRWLAVAGRPEPERSNGEDTALVVPLVLGGDDVTAICDGRHALGLARQFLGAFERRSGEAPTLARVARAALGAGRLSAAAGVAVIKPHFPFHAGYDLAGQLLEQAKSVKWQAMVEGRPVPVSAFDFHVLYDSSGADLVRIRAARTADGGATCLWGGPYVVVGEDLPATLAGPARAWLGRRDVALLDQRVEAIRERRDGRRLLPASMLHQLRSDMFDGAASADDRLRLLWARYRDQGLGRLVERDGDEPSLFRQGEAGRVTGFLDALDIVDLWPLAAPEPGQWEGASP
jgi:hypothetical protein